jgi:hypothetical protein
MSIERRTDMKVLRNLSWTRVSALFAVVVILSGALMSPAAMAQEEKAVENFPGVLQRDITLWSDGTRLSGVLLYPKDRKEGGKLPAIVMCNGWGGTKAFLMRSGIDPRFAAEGYVVINYDYRSWGDSDSRLVVRGEMSRPDKDGYVTVKAQAIRRKATSNRFWASRSLISSRYTSQAGSPISSWALMVRFWLSGEVSRCGEAKMAARRGVLKLWSEMGLWAVVQS